MARQTAHVENTPADDTVHPLNAATDKVYVLCRFDTADGQSRQAGIPMLHFTPENGPNKGLARWGSKGGKYGSVCDSRFDLPVSGYVATFDGKGWIRHSEDFTFVHSDAVESVQANGDVYRSAAGSNAPEGADTVTVTVAYADGRSDILRLVNWVREARSGRQTGIRTRLALLGLEGSAKRSNAAAVAKPAKVNRNVGGVEIL